MLMRTPTRWRRPKLVRPSGFIVPCQPILAIKVPTFVAIADAVRTLPALRIVFELATEMGALDCRPMQGTKHPITP